MSQSCDGCDQKPCACPADCRCPDCGYGLFAPYGLPVPAVPLPPEEPPQWEPCPNCGERTLGDCTPEEPPRPSEPSAEGQTIEALAHEIAGAVGMHKCKEGCNCPLFKAALRKLLSVLRAAKEEALMAVARAAEAQRFNTAKLASHPMQSEAAVQILAAIAALREGR